MEIPLQAKLEESITALNQLLELNPENTEARQTLYETMQQILRKDAFLAYEGETDVIYKVRTSIPSPKLGE